MSGNLTNAGRSEIEGIDLTPAFMKLIEGTSSFLSLASFRVVSNRAGCPTEWREFKDTSCTDVSLSITSMFNYFQTFHWSTGVNEHLLRHFETADDMLNSYVQNGLHGIYSALNHAVLFGERVYGDLYNSRMGGLNWWLTDTTNGTPINVDCHDKVLSLKALEGLVGEQYKVGGKSNTLLCSFGTASKIKSFPVRLRESMCGHLSIVTDGDMPDDVLFFVNTDDVNVEYPEGKGVSFKEVVRNNRRFWEIFGAYTVVIHHPCSNHARLFNFRLRAKDSWFKRICDFIKMLFSKVTHSMFKVKSKIKSMLRRR